MQRGNTLTNFTESGFAVIEGIVPHSMCDRVLADPTVSGIRGAGSRAMLNLPICRELAENLAAHEAIKPLLPPGAVAIQCTLFIKSAAKNWLVTLHQDLSMPMPKHISTPGYTGWSHKHGQWFAQPPVNVLEKLVAVRVHLDASTLENGPLRVVPGSHCHGKLTDEQAEELRQKHGEQPIPCSRGGTILMRPLLLHASSKANLPLPRRVLHFIFGT